MKVCAVCGKTISPTFDLCKKCIQYKDELWCKALIKIEKHTYYLEKNHPEIPFVDFDDIESILK